MIHLHTSTMLIGLTPGHLFSGMSRQALKAVNQVGSTKLEHSLCPTEATDLHMVTDV